MPRPGAVRLRARANGPRRYGGAGPNRGCSVNAGDGLADFWATVSLRPVTGDHHGMLNSCGLINLRRSPLQEAVG